MRFVRCKTTSEYEAMILTPEQAYAVLHSLREPERTLTLLAAGTGLRISECLGLQWQDVSFAEAVIQVRRTWCPSPLLGSSVKRLTWNGMATNNRETCQASFCSSFDSSDSC